MTSSTLFYEVWDMTSRNMLGSFGTEWEALALVRELADDPLRLGGLALVWDDEERGAEIASGRELVTRARAADPTSA